MGKVTVVGSYIVALVMDTDRIPLEGETVFGKNYHTTHGGKGSNMAACAARLGADSAFMGKIGRDSFGKGFIELMKSEGVNRDFILYSEKMPTAVGWIVFSSKGTNIIIIDIGANGDFLSEDVHHNQEIIKSSNVILSPLEIPIDTALTAAEIGRANGVKTILNPAPAIDLRSKDLSSVFVLTPNETEGRICLGLDPDDQISDAELATDLLKLGTENVIITRGASGVIWASKNGLKKIPALKVDVVDSVGAGDAFNAGLAVGLSENKPMIEAIALGITAASISTKKRETIESYPDRGKVDDQIHNVLSEINL